MARRKLEIGVCSDSRAPFARQLVEGIARFSTERGDWSLQMTSGVPFLTAAFMDEWRGDGFIGGVTPRWHRKLTRDGIPYVNISSQFARMPVPAVVVDNEAVGRLAAEHLMGKGLRHFAVVGFKQDCRLTWRCEGFRRRIEGEGLPCERLGVRRMVRHGEVVGQDVEEVRLFLQRVEEPMGIFAMDDPMARGIVQAAQELDRIVPEEVAVLGEGNWPVVSDIMIPPLSSIDLGADRIGYRAAEVLQSILDGKPAPQEPILIPPRNLIQRRSTETLAVEDEDVRRALQFIQDHCREPIQASDVERAAPVSRRTLERRFLRHVGRTIGQELRRTRIRTACQLLAETDLPIYAISTACGFVNRQRFNVAFITEIGMTPSKYRRVHVR